MIDIVSDNNHIESLILKTVKIIQENGGYFHPLLQIRSEKGSMSIHSKLDASFKDVVIYVPDSCLPATDDFFLDIENSEFVIKGIKNKVTLQQKKLMELSMALLNSANKIETHVKYSFKLNLYHQCREVFSLINAVESGESYMQDGKLDVLGDFLSTRMIDYRRFSDKSPLNIFMPAVDWLNHHGGGREYFINMQNGEVDGLMIFHRKMIPGSTEIFTTYGPWDALALLWKMSFFLKSIDFVRSVPLNILLKNGQSLLVHRRNIKPGAVPEAAKNIEFFFPAINRLNEKAIEISQLIIPGKKNPKSLRRIIEILLRNIFTANEATQWLESEVERIESILIQENKNFYNKLMLLTPVESYSSLQLREMCQQSLEIIKTYEEFSPALPLIYLS